MSLHQVANTEIKGLISPFKIQWHLIDGNGLTQAMMELRESKSTEIGIRISINDPLGSRSPMGIYGTVKSRSARPKLVRLATENLIAMQHILKHPDRWDDILFEDD